MTPNELQDVLNRLGVVKFAGNNVAPCKMCQPEETEPEKFKLYVNSGNKLPVVLFCMRCCVPKAQYTEDIKHNRRVVNHNVVESGIDTNLFYTQLDRNTIETLWTSLNHTPYTEKVENRVNDKLLHFFYDGLLNSLTLSDRHRRWLNKRGLDPNKCYEAKYRSFPTNLESKHLARRLYKEYGEVCNSVPGLTRDGWLTREGALLIPCRDEKGQIVAIKQRLMHDGKARMRLLSGNGPKAKQVIHFPLGTEVNRDKTLWITEGERKADYLYHKFDYSVVGVPGVGSIGQCIEPALRAKDVVLALDKDVAGLRAAFTLAHTLLDKGVRVQVAKWDKKYAKIDDAIANGSQFYLVGVDLSSFASKNEQQSGKKSQKELTKEQVFEYIKQVSPVLRTRLQLNPFHISSLISEGRVQMEKTTDGQVLRVI